MASATHHRPAVLLVASFLVLAMRGAAAADGGTSNATGGCAAEKFPAGRSYANCTALGHLGATLHWTYDAKAAMLSVAFVAKLPSPSGAGGWVAWAINPTGHGMAGAQALLALKPAASGPYSVRTYNVTGYGPLPASPTPIAFKASDLAADESAGKLRLYGKLQLKPGMKTVNHIWQVGSAVTNGAPAKHALAKENLDAKGKLALVGGAAAAATAPAPDAAGSSPSGKAGSGGSGSPAPSGGKSAATLAVTYVSAPVLAVLALVGFLATV